MANALRMPTLGELLARLDLRAPDAAGDAALRASVSGLVVADELHDDRPFLGGELVISRGCGPADVESFARMLAQRGAAGIIFAGEPGAELAELTTACERWRLPLVVAPSGVPHDLLVHAASAALHDEPARALVRLVRGEHELSGIGMTDGSRRSVLAVVVRELGCAAWLCTGGLVFAPAGQAELPDQARRTLVEATADESRLLEVPLGGGRRGAVFDVRSAPSVERPAGHLVCALPRAQAMRPEVRLAIQQSLRFIELMSATTNARRVERQRCAGEFLRRVDANSADRDELDAWLRVLGVEARGHLVCVVAETEADGVISGMLEDLADWLEIDRIVATRGTETSAFLFVDDLAQDVTDKIEELLPELGRHLGLAVTYGSTSVIAVDAADVVRALWDARQVCRLNRLRVPVDHDVPDGVSSSSLAVLLSDENARLMLHSTVLAELIAYDERHATELVRSLDVFLSECGNWSAAAATLEIHVNTLRYRLNRVEKVTGRRLSSMSDRVDFFVALKADALGSSQNGAGGERRAGATPSAREQAVLQPRVLEAEQVDQRRP